MENNESALCALRAPSQTEIEPANQSYLHRSKAGIGHLTDDEHKSQGRGKMQGEGALQGLEWRL